MTPEARRLLEQARAADALGTPASERVLRELTSRLARGESALPDIDASLPAVPELSWLAKLTSTLAGKLGLGAVALLVIGGGVLIVQRAPQPAARSAQSSPITIAAPTVPAPAATPARPTHDSVEAAEPLTQPTTKAEPRTRAQSVRRVGRARASSATASQPEPTTPALALAPEPAPEPEPVAALAPSPSPPSPAPPTLDDELALLRRAYSELNAGRAERAFEVLDVHAQRFPHGELEEAREVARMLALCAMGREPAAKVRAQHFLATRPDSPFAGRVRGICPPNK